MKRFFKQNVIIEDTGEVKEMIAIIPEAKDKKYTKVFELFSRKLLEDLKIINGEAKLLMWFLAKTVELPYQSDMWIPVDYNKLSVELMVHKEVIKRYIKKLKQMGYIEQFQTRQKIFRIKPDFVYKGILQKYKEDEDNTINININKNNLPFFFNRCRS